MLNKLNDYSEKELKDRLILINQQDLKIESELKKINKKNRRLLWLWLLIPFFGLIIYYFHYSIRLKSNYSENDIINQYKLEQTKLQFEKMKIMLILEEKK